MRPADRFLPRLSRRTIAAIGALALGLSGLPAGQGARALDQVDFSTTGGEAGLDAALRAASLVLGAQAEGRTAPQDVFAAAQADYGRLLGVLYAAGHYSPTINIAIDGREAGEIPPLNPPTVIRTIRYRIDPGPPFRFGQAAIGPLAPGTALPSDYATGATARSGSISDAAAAAVAGWRDAGHPKAAVQGQQVTADHRSATLDSRLTVAPGPRATLGALRFTGQQRMREDRMRAIAGFPSGTTFSPDAVQDAADRLRRTGAFRSVALTEAERVAPDGTLDITATVIEETPRRIGFGAEVASFDGLTLSGFWLHRNLLGGAERLRFDAEIAQIGSQNSGVDIRAGVTFERPATFTPDTVLSLSLEGAHVEDTDQTYDRGEAAAGVTHFFSDRLTGRARLAYRYLDVRDSGGLSRFRNLSLPVSLTWDRRDNAFDARRGTFLEAEVAPYLGFGTTNSGGRVVLDARGFQPLGDRIVLAGRVQAGAVLADGLLRTPRDYLFYSGGGGTVRGHPYQALGVNILRGGTQRTGGMRFLSASAEVRARFGENIGAVAFFDIGHVGAQEFFDAAGGWHSGAGLGLRYGTPIGPIRLDVAAPVSGNTGRGVQIYIGIGQAF
jgi:translocation and assembly module TamA